ncbi:MAG: single-stranded-DNA-specific exonuclease RecJ [Acidobacteria bacterium]|nr:MAG: single-stranded-DNA-specific exonuclease RecJ [Acidobacteriota bacterium]
MNAVKIGGLANMLWKIAEPDVNLVRNLARALNISGILAILLVNRGMTDVVAARRFLNPRLEYLEDPFLMSDLEAAVNRILAAIHFREKILIYGDYDVDGTTAVVILRKALEMLGARTSYYIPRRLVDGYGMKADVIEQAATEGVKLVISVDTGIKAFDVVERASWLGLDCIITDHHLPEKGLPKALAVLNPKRPDCQYPDKNLCGVGVAFKLVQALFKTANKEKYLAPFLKIVAIGTIADIVPLTGENRIFAKFGLEGLQIPVNFGLKSLIEVSGLEGRLITSSDVGFRLAPRINAVGRMGGGEQAVELFASTDEQKTRVLAGEMDRLNRERQQIEGQILKDIENRFDSNPALSQQWVIMIDGEGWHRGVIGIAATKLTEKFNRPALVISKDDGIGYGSARSIKGFHLLNALESCRDLFDRFGGHAQAAGFQLPVKHMAELRRRLNIFAEKVIKAEDLRPALEIDTEIRLSDVDDEAYQQLERLSPFGPANPEPVFAARELSVIAEPRLLKGKHVKFRVEQDGKALDAIGWNMAQYYQPIQESKAISLAFTLSQNSFQNMKFLQLIVKDLEIL